MCESVCVPVYAWACVHTHTHTACLWRSEDSLGESVSSIHNVGPRNKFRSPASTITPAPCFCLCSVHSLMRSYAVLEAQAGLTLHLLLECVNCTRSPNKISLHIHGLRADQTHHLHHSSLCPLYPFTILTGSSAPVHAPT